jgi:hypothetical protein
VVSTSYSELFVVIATSAATLIGLLFVALSVAKGRARNHPAVIRAFRAAASLLAFSNAFSVSLFGLVPTNNIGYPALVVGVFGIFFTAAGVRTTFSLPAEQRRRGPQFALIGGLLVLFGFQVVLGAELIGNGHRHGALAALGDVLIASLLIGIGRAWELVSDWDTGIVSSLGLLFGRQSKVPTETDSEDSAQDETRC